MKKKGKQIFRKKKNVNQRPGCHQKPKFGKPNMGNMKIQMGNKKFYLDTQTL